MARSPRTQPHSRWNESHPKSAKAHFARAPQKILPRKCWNEPHDSLRLPVRLIQLQGSEPAPQQDTEFASATSRPAQSPPHPSNHLHQSGQRDSNPRHSAWETRFPRRIPARNRLAALRSRVRVPASVPFVPFKPRKCVQKCVPRAHGFAAQTPPLCPRGGVGSRCTAQGGQ